MFITLIQILLLIVIAYHDYAYRSIPLLFFVLLMVVTLMGGLLQNPILLFLQYIGINFLFILLFLSLVSVYFILKNRRVVWIFDKFLGWGDIVFFVFLGCVFSPVNFIVFVTMALILSLFVVFVTGFIRNMKTIPLAGMLASILIPVFIYCTVKNRNCYSDTYILSSFYQIAGY